MQKPNQFGQTVEKGQVIPGGNFLPVENDTATGTDLVAGQFVTIVDSAGGVPKIVAATADTQNIFGVVPYDARRAAIKAGQQIEIAFARGSIMYMEASAAIARGAQVMPVITGQKVATATGTGKRVIGTALDKATAAGDLIRVVLDLPGVVLP